jgi:glucan phosphoethanolaminetransferase (alkaline phosphatase superfamily)
MFISIASRKEERGIIGGDEWPNFTVRNSRYYVWGWCILCAFFFAATIAIVIVAFVQPAASGEGVGVTICAICTVGCLFGTRFYRRWRIEVRGDAFTVVPMFGKPRIFSASDISRVKRYAGGAMRAYDSSGKRLFSTEANQVGYTFLSDRLSELHL